MFTPTKRLGQKEFIAMTAMMFATIAFSIDAMLPALPAIADDISADAPNRVPLIITSFVLGMGVGTLLAGPISDRFGRRSIIILGGILYIIGAALASMSHSLDMILAARVLQGMGAAGPRVVGLAVVRDQYSGRDMARITSFVMMIFTLLPAIAPTIGAALVYVAGWRGIFGAFIVFSMFSVGWFTLRQPETLPVESRRPLHLATMARAVVEIFSHRLVVVAILIQTCIYSTLFMYLGSTQQVFDQYFDEGAHFHVWVGLIALIAGSGSFTNAQLVGRLGMYVLVRATLNLHVVLTAIALVVLGLEFIPGGVKFVVFVFWSITVFGALGLTIGNLNALSMEPLGHIAGLSASIIGATAMIASSLIAGPVATAFDGTPLPMVIGILTMVVLARLLFFVLPKA